MINSRFFVTGTEIVTQLVPIPDSVLNMAGRASKATYELVFRAVSTPALGYQSFYVSEKLGDGVDEVTPVSSLDAEVCRKKERARPPRRHFHENKFGQVITTVVCIALTSLVGVHLESNILQVERLFFFLKECIGQMFAKHENLMSCRCLQRHAQKWTIQNYSFKLCYPSYTT